MVVEGICEELIKTALSCAHLAQNGIRCMVMVEWRSGKQIHGEVETEFRKSSVDTVSRWL